MVSLLLAQAGFRLVGFDGFGCCLSSPLGKVDADDPYVLRAKISRGDTQPVFLQGCYQAVKPDSITLWGLPSGLIISADKQKDSTTRPVIAKVIPA